LLPPISPLLPYTTLFRSVICHLGGYAAEHVVGSRLARRAADHFPGLRLASAVLRRRQETLLSAAFPRQQALRERRALGRGSGDGDRKSTRLNSSHQIISY